jgi:CheY-like chemotaxis protein
LFAGRKLLVADDSSYYRTVISLTFSDEGMEVTTAVDGREALEKLEQSTPDVILASVSMPGLGGYELCRLIKESERFGRIPVMLLAGLHESFDQAETRRVGADDVVTKPFQSIRQLVSRVGSLLGGKAADAEGTGHEYSTLGLGAAGADQPAADDREVMPEPNIPVFVEAASLSEPESITPEVEARTEVADVALQTADTQKLERIDDEPAGEAVEPIAYAQDDTIEMEPAIESVEMHSPPAAEPEEESQTSIGAAEMNDKPSYQTAPLQNLAVVQDALLDLGDFDSTATVAVTDDLILDLDYEEPAGAPAVAVAEAVPETVAAVAADAPAESVAPEPESVARDPEYAAEPEYFAPEPEYVAPEPEFVARETESVVPEPAYEEQPVESADFQEWAIVSGAPAADAIPVSPVEEQTSAEPGVELSPAAIDAIARRVIEHMSDAVVREIAWEVVPELAELLIKKKLDEQK